MPSRVPVLIGVAAFEETGNQGVAFVVDLTERKRDQDALNRASTELARVFRATALSALTVSIAHEVNQPLAGVINNAGTCLRMLDGSPPNIDGARETARRMIRDGNRAAAVIARLRALFSKREFALESLDLNDAIRSAQIASVFAFMPAKMPTFQSLAKNGVCTPDTQAERGLTSDEHPSLVVDLSRAPVTVKRKQFGCSRHEVSALSLT